MRRALLLTAIVSTLLIIYHNYYTETYAVGEEIVLENLSLRVLETKTEHTIVRRPLVANELPGGVYFSEGKGFEALDALPGHRFFLVKLELKNLGEERLHLMGKEYKVLSTADGEVFYAGVLSRKTRNASDEESEHHRYPILITIRTLLPRQRAEGWITFEIPEATEAWELLWYTDFQNRRPAFRVKLN